jgi:toxin HigB-1
LELKWKYNLKGYTVIDVCRELNIFHSVEVDHRNSDLARLEIDIGFRAQFDVPIVTKFRVVMQIIRTVSQRNELYKFRGLRLEKLTGQRKNEWSMRLNKKWRLIAEFPEPEPNEKIVIVGIEKHYE